MTARERFWLWADYESKDLPAWGDWVKPYEFWVRQGMPPMPEGQTDEREYMRQYFGFEGIYSAFWGQSRLPVELGIYPGYKPEVLWEDETHEIVRGTDGIIGKRLKKPDSVLIATQYLEHPLKGPENWEEFKRTQLNPHDPGRYPDDVTWQLLREKWGEDRSHIITVDAGSFYGILRNWMGVENASYALYDEPDWVAEVMEYLADFYIAALGKAVRDFKIDIGMFWEDICYKNGPLISPEMFRRFCLRPYQKVTSFLKENGVKLCFVDCDGNIEQLLPLWLEGGVRGFYPLEAAAGMDAEKLLKQYRKDKILLWGNVDKREIAKGPEAIEAELERLAPAVQMGGFIPLIDHGVPENISFADFSYYNARRKEKFGVRLL